MRSARLGLILAAAVSTVACGGGVDSEGSSTSSGGSSSGGSSSGGSSSGVVSSSSGGSSGVLPNVNPGFTAVARGGPLEHFAGVTLPGFDGAVLRQARDMGDPSPISSCTAANPDKRNVQEAVVGDPCKGAADRAVCANELACLFSETGFRPEGNYQIQSYYYFVFGQAGTLTKVTTRTELLTRLGAIDSAPKAMVLATLEAKFRAYVVGYRAAVAGGWDIQMRGGGPCAGSPEFEAIIHVGTDGAVSELEKTVSTKPESGCSEGRRPIGLIDCPRGGIESGIADYLAEAAHLEAAAVFAFEEMASTLRAFGAPASLVRAAEAAQRDEIRHARTMTKLARAFGAEPREVRVEKAGTVDLEALALVNAVEGCVRETYAVTRAIWQSKHAAEPRIRAAYAIIARDETKHAELSWALAEWLESKLDADARARVEAARHRAVTELRYELQATPHPDVVRQAGMPDVGTGLRLFDELFARLELTEAA